LYEHFASKEDLVEAIVITILQDIREQRRAIIADATLPLATRLHKVLTVRPQAFSPPCDRNIQDIKRYLPSVWEKIEQFIDEEWVTIESLLQEGVQQGYFRPVSVPFVTKVLKGAMKEMMEDSYRMRNNLSAAEMKESLADVILHGIVVAK
jgi:AcrR family transcriptional regulator